MLILCSNTKCSFNCAVYAKLSLITVLLHINLNFQALEVEFNARWPRVTKVIESGNALRAQKHSESVDISHRIEGLKKNWDKLHELWSAKSKQLEDASAAYQVH